MKTDYSLLSHNTFGIDARTSYFAEYETEEQLRELIRWYHSQHDSLPLLHIGRGSNLLFLGDFQGLVLHSRIFGWEVLSSSNPDEVLLRVGAGMVWDEWVENCVFHGWYGLENLSLIPGEVGASAVQNIGAYGVEVGEFIHSVEAISLNDGSKHVFSCDECNYSYRQSVFKGELRGQYAITYVTYRLSLNFTPNLSYRGIQSYIESQGQSMTMLTADQLRDAIIAIRRQKLPDPALLANAGSFFINPVVDTTLFLQIQSKYPEIPHYHVDEMHEKIPAGWLIEQAGWKGRSLGPAAVHQHQALVLVNQGHATGKDILNLCQAVCDDVRKKFGITLHPEVNFIGDV